MKIQNWKTTLAGIVAICSALYPFVTDLLKGDYGGAFGQLPQIVTGIGLILAKDFDVKI